MRFTILIILLFAPTLVACGQSSSPDPTTELNYYFPQQASVAGERAVMDALLYGQLVSSDGCLRVSQRDSGTTYLVIWPPDVTLSKVNGFIGILDQSGQIVAQVGDNIRISGGEVSTITDSLNEALSQPVPETCPGPYWVAGEEIRVDPPTPSQTVSAVPLASLASATPHPPAHYSGPNPYRSTPSFDVQYDPAVWEYVEDDTSGRRSQLMHRNLPGCVLWLRAGPVGARFITTKTLADYEWKVSQVQTNILHYSTSWDDIWFIFGLILPDDYSGGTTTPCQQTAESVISTFSIGNE